jgi:hypothetical protein
MSVSPRTVFDHVLCTAFRRGVSQPRRARAPGVSPQRVQQILKRNGLTAADRKQRVPSRGVVRRVGLTCEVCGQTKWLAPWQARSPRYCSLECCGKPRRRITDECALKAIELREAGWTWREIENEVGGPWQSLTQRDWHSLHERGQLNEANVATLLQDVRERLRPRWAWLEKATGLGPEPLAEAAA